jgi:outer membrane protein assembly factor BamB
MARDAQTLVFVGILEYVVAVDSQTGAEIWRTELKGSDFVSVLWDGEMLLAANAGEVFRLDPRDGTVRWHNKMKGLGRGVVSLASQRAPGGSNSGDVAAAKKKRNDDAAAADVAS